MTKLDFLSKEEKENMPKLSRKKVGKIIAYLKPFLFPLTSIFILEAICSSISLFPQYLSKSIVDDALLGKNMKLLTTLLLLSLIFGIVNFGINRLSSTINENMELKITNNLKAQLFNKFASMDHDFFKNEKMSAITNCLCNDVYSFVSFILKILPNIFSSISIFITALVAMGTVDWRLILAGIAVFPLECLPKRLSDKMFIDNFDQKYKIDSECYNFVDENLCVKGSLLTKLFTKEKSISGQFSAILKKHYELRKKRNYQGLFLDLIYTFLSKANSLLVYFVAGYLMIIQENNAITVGSITMTIALCTRLTQPIETLMDSYAQLLVGFSSFDRILGYLDKENKIVPPANGIKEKVCDGEIEFRSVDFSYEEDTPLLKNVNFKLPAGKCFAIVGPSGAGKSSIINLIPRLYDTTSGQITFGGVDIKDIDLEYLRSNIGVVNQDTYLFNGTILENLKYAKEDATQEEIEKACKNANIHDFIVSQPDKYESLVGNGGLRLSGGERQRLAIARVLLKDPKILILDEATSALDSINESAIQEALDRLLVGRTSIIIAHRLSTVLKADKIMVLKDGEIVEMGTHKDLVEQNGVYKELYETQFRKVLDMEKERA